MSTLLHDSWQTARKQHRCDLCEKLIEPGERYYRQDVVDAGDRWSFKAHGACERAARWWCDERGASFEDVPTHEGRLFLMEFLDPWLDATLRRDDDGRVAS